MRRINFAWISRCCHSTTPSKPSYWFNPCHRWDVLIRNSCAENPMWVKQRRQYVRNTWCYMDMLMPVNMSSRRTSKFTKSIELGFCLKHNLVKKWCLILLLRKQWNARCWGFMGSSRSGPELLLVKEFAFRWQKWRNVWTKPSGTPSLRFKWRLIQVLWHETVWQQRQHSPINKEGCGWDEPIFKRTKYTVIGPLRVA